MLKSVSSKQKAESSGPIPVCRLPFAAYCVLPPASRRALEPPLSPLLNQEGSRAEPVLSPLLGKEGSKGWLLKHLVPRDSVRIIPGRLRRHEHIALLLGRRGRGKGGRQVRRDLVGAERREPGNIEQLQVHRAVLKVPRAAKDLAEDVRNPGRAFGTIGNARVRQINVVAGFQNQRRPESFHVVRKVLIAVALLERVGKDASPRPTLVARAHALRLDDVDAFGSRHPVLRL